MGSIGVFTFIYIALYQINLNQSFLISLCYFSEHFKQFMLLKSDGDKIGQIKKWWERVPSVLSVNDTMATGHPLCPSFGFTHI